MKTNLNPSMYRSIHKQKGMTLIEVMIALSISMIAFVSLFQYQMRQLTLDSMDPIGKELAGYSNGARAFLFENQNAFNLGSPTSSSIVTTWGATWNGSRRVWILNGSRWLRSNACGGVSANSTGYVPCSIQNRTSARGLPFQTEISAVNPGAGLPLELTAVTTLNLNTIRGDGAMAARVAQSASSTYETPGSATPVTSFARYWANDRNTSNAVRFENIGFVYSEIATNAFIDPNLRRDGSNFMAGPLRWCIDTAGINPVDRCASPVAASERTIRGLNSIVFWSSTGGPYNTDPAYDLTQFAGNVNSVRRGHVSLVGREGHRSLSNVNRVTAEELVDYNNTNFFINMDGTSHLQKLEAMDSYTFRNHVINQGGAVVFDENKPICAPNRLNCDNSRGMGAGNYDGRNENGPKIMVDSANATFKISTANAAINRRIQLEHRNGGYVDIAGESGGPGYLAANDIVIKGLGGGPGVSILDLLPKYIFQGSELVRDNRDVRKPNCPAGTTARAIVTPQNVQIKSVQTNNVQFQSNGNADKPIVTDGTFNTYLTASPRGVNFWRVRLESKAASYSAPVGSSYGLIQKYCVYN